MISGSTVKRVCKTGDELDVFGGWRKWYCYTQNAGVCKRVKRAANRRERQQARSGLRGSVGDPLEVAGNERHPDC